MTDEPQSGAEILARIKPRLRETATNICLRPDLLNAWEEANEELVKSRARDAVGERLASGTSEATRELAERVQQIEDEIEATQLRVRFRAMPKDDWSALLEQNPPRKDNERDRFAGYNLDAVENEAVRRCMIDPVFDDESWAEFVKVLNPSEWAELRQTVHSVNGLVTNAPKSRLAATVLTKPASDSEQPKTGESTPEPSTDGFPAKSTSTSTQTAT